MNKFILLFVTVLFFTSCETEVVVPEITEIEADQDISISARTGGVSVCHKNAGEIVIGEAALDTHIAHGDAVDMDGDGFYNVENPCSEIDCDDNYYSEENSCCECPEPGGVLVIDNEDPCNSWILANCI